jgi:putative ABC transport system substrate-binding protein
MRRREFITLLGGAAVVWPVAARGQQERKIAQIGFLGPNSASSWASRLEAFRLGLQDHGYVEGKNVAIEFRWAEENYDRLPELAAELVHLKVDVLVTYGTPGTLAAKGASTTIPTVMAYIGDALAVGVIASLSRPGGNITGSTYFLSELMAKRLELLKEAMPGITRVGVLLKPDNPLFLPTLQSLEVAAGSLGVKLQQFAARGPVEFDFAFSEMARRGVDAVVIQEDAVFVSNVRAIVDLAAKHRLLSAGFIEFAEAGGVIGYGASFVEMCRRAGFCIDAILKGRNAVDIPVEQATRFELVLNLKTAQALGVIVPTSILLRADTAIE